MFDTANSGSREEKHDAHSRYDFSKPSEKPELTEQIETSDKAEIEAFLNKLDVEIPIEFMQSQDSDYNLEGEICIAHGYEDTFQYDVMEGSTTCAHFRGKLDYEQQELHIEESYREKATDVFAPAQKDSSLETTETKSDRRISSD